jgi:predicted nucleotidyltransferase component of viral defense system
VITKTEIEEKSKVFEVHTSNVQRDYVFGWFLIGLYSESILKELLFLKGGNALRKCYFENTRYSADLDFGIETDIDKEVLEGEIDKICDFIQANAGVVFEKERTKINEKFRAQDKLKVYEAKVYFKDFYGNADHITISIQIDITRFDNIYLPVQARFLIHPYSDYGQAKVQIRCMKLEEILGTKLKCLLQRQHSPDLYDYVYSLFMNNLIEINKPEIVTTFLKKTIFEPSPGVVKNLLLGLPLELFRHFWNKVVCPRQSIVDFNVALTNFKENIVELFGVYPDRGEYAYAYFPAESRNVIIEAGRNCTLLEVVYDGVKRLVEPYSLVYKQPQGQSAREYLYVYDRTGGGRSGTVGIKSFLHEKITSITNTGEAFEPRYTIELSKAGEYTEKSYFGKPFSERLRQARSLRRRSTYRSQIRYVFQFISCNRRFTKTRMNGKLGKHKDKYRNQCFGRAGYYVATHY